VLVVEDVITTGGSIARACEALLAAGHAIAAIAVIVDREAGGREALQAQFGAPVFALFNRADFPEAK
jgi:orotate phosphoribosyltransferase